MAIWIGTSGWQYRDWRGVVYSPETPQSSWLEQYATRFPTVEVNNTFYRLPDTETFTAWSRRTPPGFVFAVKASRYLTHVKRLQEPGEPVHRLLERLRGLDPKLGPVLVQVPPTMQADPERLAGALDAFEGRCRLAVEFRHSSWWSDRVYEVLATRDVALCVADRRGPSGPLVRTASWLYARLHEGQATPRPCYGRRALESWLERLVQLGAAMHDTFVFCNNDAHACAPRNAIELARLARRGGLPVASLDAPRTDEGVA